jgi:hypothetical protein
MQVLHAVNKGPRLSKARNPFGNLSPPHSQYGKGATAMCLLRGPGQSSVRLECGLLSIPLSFDRPAIYFQLDGFSFSCTPSPVFRDSLSVATFMTAKHYAHPSS